MSLQMAAGETCVWSGSAKSNKADTWSAKATDAKDALEKANSIHFKPGI